MLVNWLSGGGIDHGAEESVRRLIRVLAGHALDVLVHQASTVSWKSANYTSFKNL